MDGMKKAVERIISGDKDNPARVSLALHVATNARLEYIIDRLDTTKQNLIETAVEGMLYDIEIKLGLRKDEIIVNERGERVHPATDDYSKELYKSVVEKNNKAKK